MNIENNPAQRWETIAITMAVLMAILAWNSWHTRQLPVVYEVADGTHTCHHAEGPRGGPADCHMAMAVQHVTRFVTQTGEPVGEQPPVPSAGF